MFHTTLCEHVTCIPCITSQPTRRWLAQAGSLDSLRNSWEVTLGFASRS